MKIFKIVSAALMLASLSAYGDTAISADQDQNAKGKAEILEVMSNLLKSQGYRASDFVHPDTFEKGQEVFADQVYDDSVGETFSLFNETYVVTNGPLTCKVWFLVSKKYGIFHQLENDNISCQ